MTTFRATKTRVVAILIAATLALTGCGFHGLYTASLPGGPNLGGHPYTVTIIFSDVLDLVPQSNVKVNDVAVGKVVGVNLYQNGWLAQVKVRVNGNVHLYANAIANVMQTSLLGEKFVELANPLSGGTGELKNGDTIPITRTGSAPDVEVVLGSLALLLNEGGLQQIQTISRELNNALNGHEAAVHDLLAQLNGFVGDLDKQKDAITGALVNIDRLAVTLNQQKKSLTDALDTFPGALKILADDRTQFVTLLQSLAHLGDVATQVITATDTQLSTALRTLSPVLEQLTLAGNSLPTALKFLLTFPFPVGKATTALKGDYANLGLHLDISLNDNLCGLQVPGLCNLINSLLPTKPPKAAATTQSAQSSALNLSTLPGLGG